MLLAHWLSLVVAVAAGPTTQASSPRPIPRTFRVASSQLRSTTDLDSNVAKICDQIRACGRKGIQVVVFPECAVTGYFAEAAKRVSRASLQQAEARISVACREAGVSAIVGSPWREGDKLFNSALVYNRLGQVVERYHKVQLAESWPTPGDHLSVFKLDGVACSIIICHDERYPELVRLPVLAGSRVIFYLSHESGLLQEKKLAPYRAQIQARAVENSVFVVQSNAPANPDASGSHGQSRVVAPDGNLVGDEASIFGEDLLVADLDLDQATAANALRSLQRGPLQEWWQTGAQRVRCIDSPALPSPESNR